MARLTEHSEEMTLAEAIACRLTFSKLGYPSKATKHVLHIAGKVIESHANAAASRIEKGLCTTCWGDGWRRVGINMLSGPCERCEGTGRLALEQSSRDGGGDAGHGIEQAREQS